MVHCLYSCWIGVYSLCVYCVLRSVLCDALRTYEAPKYTEWTSERETGWKINVNYSEKERKRACKRNQKNRESGNGAMSVRTKPIKRIASQWFVWIYLCLCVYVLFIYRPGIMVSSRTHQVVAIRTNVFDWRHMKFVLWTNEWEHIVPLKK